jgi:hypothetical protein
MRGGNHRPGCEMVTRVYGGIRTYHGQKIRCSCGEWHTYRHLICGACGKESRDNFEPQLPEPWVSVLHDDDGGVWVERFCSLECSIRVRD